ncbi:6-pyruvoyl tetrahydrobiopterin synthase-like protein [Ramicandelaber brevisporus]|nr:6-pyruvoyl tetrahydrobiopterin synthase-like protein [Ramicandelaber brevisporus]
MAPVVTLTRRQAFSAAHRLASPHLTPEENQSTFGKCHGFHGHGHNYVVEVTVKGPIDPRTGMVMNLQDLKEAIDRAVMDQLDHKNIDLEVEWFNRRSLNDEQQRIPSTAENIAVFIWQGLLESGLIPKERLFEVKLYETEKNFVTYRGEQD